MAATLARFSATRGDEAVGGELTVGTIPAARFTVADTVEEASSVASKMPAFMAPAACRKAVFPATRRSGDGRGISIS